MEHYTAVKKEGTLTFCDSMDGIGVYYAKWDNAKWVRDKYHLISLICGIKWTI